jgi:hypothetical protein
MITKFENLHALMKGYRRRGSTTALVRAATDHDATVVVHTKDWGDELAQGLRDKGIKPPRIVSLGQLPGKIRGVDGPVFVDNAAIFDAFASARSRIHDLEERVSALNINLAELRGVAARLSRDLESKNHNLNRVLDCVRDLRDAELRTINPDITGEMSREEAVDRLVASLTLFESGK